MSTSQRSRILSWLGAGPVCGTTMLRFHIPRYAARINELRRDGYTIVTRPCQQDHGHTTPQVEYVLLEGQLELIP